MTGNGSGRFGPRITRVLREWRKGESERGPRNTRTTRNGGREEGTAETEKRTEFFTTKHTKDSKGGGRKPEKLPANHAEGRE